MEKLRVINMLLLLGIIFGVFLVFDQINYYHELDKKRTIRVSCEDVIPKQEPQGLDNKPQAEEDDKLKQLHSHNPGDIF